MATVHYAKLVNHVVFPYQEIENPSLRKDNSPCQSQFVVESEAEIGSGHSKHPEHELGQLVC